MSASGWIISAIAVAIALIIALNWERTSRRDVGRKVDTAAGRGRTDELQARHEFMSPPWIDMARRQITGALAGRDLDVEPFTLSEEFTDPPAHLQPRGEPIGFYVRVGRGEVEVGGRPEPLADCRVISDYTDALSVARDTEMATTDAAEAERRMAAGRLRIVGDPTRMPRVLQQLDLHRLLASRTA